MAILSESLNKARRLVWPLIHRLLKSISDGYAITNTTEDEYVATFLESQEELEDRLPELKFHRTPIASLKIRLDGNVSDGSWMRRDSTLAAEQLHVVLHEVKNREAVDVYAHSEDNWIRHPLLHLRKRNYSAKRSVSSVRTLLDASKTNGNDVPIEVEPRYRRDGPWFLYLIHLVSKPTARKVHDMLSDPDV